MLGSPKNIEDNRDVSCMGHGQSLGEGIANLDKTAKFWLMEPEILIGSWDL